MLFVAFDLNLRTVARARAISRDMFPRVEGLDCRRLFLFYKNREMTLKWPFYFDLFWFADMIIIKFILIH